MQTEININNKDKLRPVDSNTVFTKMIWQVNTYDIDAANHVNNIVYLRWLEEMRNKLFTQIYSLEKMIEAKHYLVVVSCEMKYKKQIKLSDIPEGTMYLQNYSHGVFVLKAEIKVDNQLAFLATQKCVLIKLSNNKIFKGSINEIHQYLENEE